MSKLRSLDKKRKRERRIKYEEKFANKSFNEQWEALIEKRLLEEKQRKINEMFETIRALQLINASDPQISCIKRELNNILKPNKYDGRASYNQQREAIQG